MHFSIRFKQTGHLKSSAMAFQVTLQTSVSCTGKGCRCCSYSVSRHSSSSKQEAESPGKQPSPQPYSARLEALAAAVTAKESEAAELRKRMLEMSQEFNAHLSASGSWPEQFSAEAGVVHQVRVIRELICSAVSKC